MEIKSKPLLPRRLVEYSEFERCCWRDLYDLTLWQRRIVTACAAIAYKLQPQRPSSRGKPTFLPLEFPIARIFRETKLASLEPQQ